jgi:phage tail sheath protein FI
MPLPLTYPGVYIEELQSNVHTITGVATSIGLFIGWAARGPTDQAVRIASFTDYQRSYGPLDQRTLLGYAVQEFFDNGGSDAYVIRVAATNAKPASVAAGDLTFTAASPGEWANSYRVRLTPRAAPDNKRFKVEVLDDPTLESVVEVYENLSVDSTDGRFVQSAINGVSTTITVTTASSPNPPTAVTTVTLKNGNDGDVLDPNSTNTTLANNFNTAVKALFAKGAIADRIDLFNLVCVPGESEKATIQALQTSCKNKRAFLIVDCTQAATVSGAPAELTSMNGADASYAGYFFPWVQAPDALQNGAVRPFPPCGYVAGVCARTDAARGVWKAPAGIDSTLTGAVGFQVPMSDAENGDLNPHAVNCLRALPVYGNVVWGSRTMDGDNDRASQWKYIPVRRMALFLEESLFRGTQWVVFEPNDEPLWASIRLNIGAFMQTLFRQGAFQGTSPRQAYFVKCDSETTTQADIDLGIVNIIVGFAPLKPAEFVVIQIQQIAGELQT